jgi:uncharacterized protein
MWGAADHPTSAYATVASWRTVMRTLLKPDQILGVTHHRPFPLPAGRWIQRQRWNDFLFCHWPVPVAEVRAVVPRDLELDLWEREAWVGVIPFHMSGVTLRHLPDLPGFSTFPELNVRTYVRSRGTPGVHFLSLDAHNGLAVWIARRWYGLPYFRARMSWTREQDAVRYTSVRTPPGTVPARYAARYSTSGLPRPVLPGSFEEWLVERYALFTVARGRVLRGDVHHHAWPVQSAEIEIAENTMALANGLHLPDTSPHVLYSPGVDVVAWPPLGPRGAQTAPVP